MKKRSESNFSLVGVVFLLVIFSINCIAADGETTSSGNPVIVTQNASLGHEVEEVIAKGTRYLISTQIGEGYWNAREHPSTTALALIALQGQPSRSEQLTTSLQKGYGYLQGCIQPNGSIHGGKGLVIYNTALSLMALMAEQPRFRAEAMKARNFLITSQVDRGTKGKVDSLFDGGFSDGTETNLPNLLVTVQVLEALYYSKSLEQGKRDGKPPDIDWEAAANFLQKCQNFNSNNQQLEINVNSPVHGSFGFFSSNQLTKSINGEQSESALEPSDYATYVGILGYTYAKVQKDNPRFIAAMNWLRKNSLAKMDSNLKEPDLYYCYYVIAKELTLNSPSEFELNFQNNTNGREGLALKLMDLQNSDGSWSKVKHERLQSSTTLGTCYSLIALQLILREL